MKTTAPLTALLTALLLAGAARAEEGTPAPRRVVTQEQAVAAAAGGHPNVKGAEASAISAHARVDGAAASVLPQISAGASYRLGGQIYEWRAPSQSLGASFSISQTIWDFGQTANRIEAAEVNAGLADMNVSEAVRAARGAARSAFAAARAQGKLVAVSAESLANQTRHLDEVSRYVAAGLRPEIDLYQSRSQVASARLGAVQAENAYDLAKAKLNGAMGVLGGTAYDVADEAIPPVPGEEGGTDALFEEALRHRSELKVLQAQRLAQELSLDSTRATRWPSLRASAGVDAGLLPLDPSLGWSLGVSLSWDVFDGGARAAAVREAKGALLGLDADILALRQQVWLEIDQARLALRAARESQTAAAEALQNARVQLRLAEARYSAGLGSALELADAQVSVTQAAGQGVQAEYGVDSARATLLDALGM